MSWLLELLAALFAALLLRRFVVNFARIHGNSMLSTLHNRDFVLVWRLPYCFRRPRRGEVVICHYPRRRMKRIKWMPQSFVKRVIGLPGDQLEIIEGVVYINGLPLDEPYLDPARCRLASSLPARTLAEDEYFVLGDHRDRSNDSRSVGSLRRSAIRGRALFILWPLNHAGKIR